MAKKLTEQIEEHIKKEPAPKHESDVWFSTGCDLLDCAVGGGQGYGYRGGKVINIVGDTQSGKTFLAWELLAAARRRYPNVKIKYDDAEHGNTFDPEILYGIKLKPEEVINSSTVQEFDCKYMLFLESIKKGEKGIYVLDTLDGVSSEEIDKLGKERLNAYKKDPNKQFDKGSYKTEIAKYLSQEFFKRAIEPTETKDVLLIIISQIRDSIDEYSVKKYTRSGGRALDFYAHSILFLQAKKQLKYNAGTAKEKNYGVVDFVKLEKNKSPRPRRFCYFTLLFDYGLDNIGSNIDFLFDLFTPKDLEYKKSAVCKWDGADRETVESLVEFLKSQNLWESYDYNKTHLKKQNLLDFIMEQSDEVQANYQAVFGSLMTRTEMIKYIEDNNLQDELTEKVRARWEELEAEALPDRKPRYK